MNLAIPTAISSHFSLDACFHALHAMAANPIAPSSPIPTPRYVTQEIARNDILEIEQPFGVTIECLAGSVWATLDGDTRDVVLNTGQVFVVDRNQKTLLQALTTARVRLIEPVRTH